MKARVRLLNIDVDTYTQAELLEAFARGVLVTPNMDHLAKLQRDRELYEIYQKAEFVIADSRVLGRALELLGLPRVPVVPGSDFFPAFCDHHARSGEVRVFLLGAAPGVADRARVRLNARAGRELIVGACSPSFGFERNEEECRAIVEAINTSGATVLAVGVGAPKQEKWIARFKEQLPGVRMFLAIGATIDFEAGNLTRAPRFLQRLGLEWLYRLATEPRRLWKRYLVEDLPVFYRLWQQKRGRYTNPFA